MQTSGMILCITSFNKVGKGEKGDGYLNAVAIVLSEN